MIYEQSFQKFSYSVFLSQKFSLKLLQMIYELGVRSSRCCFWEVKPMSRARVHSQDKLVCHPSNITFLAKISTEDLFIFEEIEAILFCYFEENVKC